MTAAIETRDISSELEADIAKFDRMLASYLDGHMDEDQFRLFRLGNGIYGQRQGGRNQMVRIKAPYGSITPPQLEALADIADGTAVVGATSPPGRTSSSTLWSSNGYLSCCGTSPRSA